MYNGMLATADKMTYVILRDTFLSYPWGRPSAPLLEGKKHGLERDVIEKAYGHFVRSVKPSIEEHDAAFRRARTGVTNVYYINRTLGDEVMKGLMKEAKKTGQEAVERNPGWRRNLKRWKSANDKVHRVHLHLLNKPLDEVREYFYDRIDKMIPVA